jgi:alpha-galactosidase
MPATERDDTEARAQWMQNREKLGRQLFGGPQPTFPLTYNTWYAVRRSVSEEFLKRQIAALSPYGFTNFVVDAGWFEKGKWEANQRKFPTNSLPTIFAALKARGIKPGLWTAPQYVTANSTELPIEQPPIQNKLLDDYLVDLSSPKFPPYLTEHVKRLRQQYAVDYWKYDQAFFDQRTAARKMKIVLGFQEALSRVRRANPDLFIENCSGGGRMLNEFTLLATQTSWLRDLARQSQPDPQANIQVALNALDFVFPWAALRFTVYMDKVGEDDEMTRLDCRSAMAGSWGFSTDLAAISERQRRVILQEIEHYRRLNRLKFACLYDLYLPTDQSDIAGVTYYDDKRQQAAILLYRWQRQGAFDQHVTLNKLNPRLRYRVVDVDRQTETPMRGAVLQSEGMNVVFSRERQSALIFIEPL